MIQGWYLFNSGFAVHTGQQLLVFDYYMDIPKHGSIADGVLRPEELCSFHVPVTVFVSHGHFDHYNPVVLSWREHVPGVRYVLSDDITVTLTCESDDAQLNTDAVEGVRIHPGQTVEMPGLTVRALESTDLGVAFLVHADGYCIYHAGDLNWWHWEGEPDADNRAMAHRYDEQLSLLQGESIDLAFLPVDPRLEDAYALGLCAFCEKVGARHIVPMHFGTQFSIFPRLLADPATASFRDRLVLLERRGYHFELDL